MTCKKQAEAQPIDGLAIVKETSTLGKLIIKGVPKEEAKRMIVENHYSHKWNEGGFGKYNFGVFRAEEPDKCLGVAVYGYMKTPPQRYLRTRTRKRGFASSIACGSTTRWGRTPKAC
ncbi:hypothetical protein [Alistipes putredinis]|jgi:hypothetical protein|uniref:Mom family adenine methylcarbamoylation protein n=1 Tax=Alistipes putredinis TaxID=28117 RepID=UPI003966B10C